MALIVADRVLETSSTTGTGAYTLAGAITGFRTATSVCANGDTFTYYAEDVDGNGVPLGGWETGLGTWNTGGLLTRTTIYASSNAGAAVSWGAGNRRIGLAVNATAALGPLTSPSIRGLNNFSSTATVTLASITQTELVSFDKTVYASGKFIIQANQGVYIHTLELLVVHNGTTAYSVQYGDVYTDVSLFTVGVTIASNNVQILITSKTVTSTVYKTFYNLIAL